MRILFIGNANRRFSGARYYGFDARFHNGLVRGGHCVFFFSDRDEAAQRRILGLRGTGAARMNAELLRVAKTFRPDAAVIAHATLVSNDTLRAMKDALPALRIAHICVDAVFNPDTAAKVRARAAVADAAFLTTGGPALSALSDGRCPFYYIPNAADPCIDTGRAFEAETPAYDVSCFMRTSNVPADDATRIPLASAAKDGVQGLRAHYRGFNGQPILRGPEYIEACGSAGMGLNLSKDVCNGFASTAQTRHLYSSDRIAHIMGNGALALASDAFGLDALFSDDEIVFFRDRDADDLCDKVRFYKNNGAERMRIAKKGWEKAHGAFGAEVVMQYVLERLMHKNLSRDYEWPVEAYK